LVVTGRPEIVLAAGDIGASDKIADDIDAVGVTDA